MIAPYISAFTPLPQRVRIPEPQTYQYSMFVKTPGHAVTNSFHGRDGICFQRLERGEYKVLKQIWRL